MFHNKANHTISLIHGCFLFERYDAGSGGYLTISKKLEACFVNRNTFLVIKNCCIGVLFIIFPLLYSVQPCTSTNINCLSASPTKWPNTLKQFVRKLPWNCLSVFHHFVKLVLKVLNTKTRNTRLFGPDFSFCMISNYKNEFSFYVQNEWFFIFFLLLTVIKIHTVKSQTLSWSWWLTLKEGLIW